MNWFFMMMKSPPILKAWWPFSQESESMSSSWFVCWNFGRKSGEPSRPRPDPPKNPSMVIPGRPPATMGSVMELRTSAAPDGCWPNGCWCASEVACCQLKRSSLTTVGLKMRVQPATTPLVLIVWSPKADVPVPSRMPPNAPGMLRCRFE